MRVLVVEDEQAMAESLAWGLEAEGYIVDVADNGTDGLWKAQETAPDVIILDVIRGIVTRQGEAATGFSYRPEAVVLHTTLGEYRTRMIVGADGSNGMIRSRLGLSRPRRIMQTMEILTPTGMGPDLERPEHTAVLDFRAVVRGLQGYYWEFPAPCRGQSMVSRGIGHTAVLPGRGRIALKPLLAERLQQQGIDLEGFRLHGHPIRWFDPAGRHSAPRVILVGDAAGTDPLFAEGITSALEFGLLAAHAAIAAMDRDDYSFSRYEDTIRTSRLGRTLWARLLVARHFYGGRAPWHDLLGVWMHQRALHLWSPTALAERRRRSPLELPGCW
jgi:flavin-dependent dehydrogenase